MSARYIIALLQKTDLPAGVVQLVNGDKEAVDELLENPSVKAISFVGSTAVARQIYSKGTLHGKRVQAQGGAKNMVVVLPDADLNMTTRSEEHTSELQSRGHLVCRLLLEKKKNRKE